jgi:hypothetical protein
VLALSNEEVETVRIKRTPKQCEAWELLTNPDDLEVMFGGAKGGGKSFFLCIWMYAWALKLIEIMQLKPSKYPLPVGFMGRKRATDFTKTTLETWKKTIPSEFYKIHELNKEITIHDRTTGAAVKYYYGGLDNTDDINKFNSFESCVFALDQAEEIEFNDIAVLKGSKRLTVGNLKHPIDPLMIKCPDTDNYRPPYKELYTANPADCWLREDFIINPKPGRYFIPALPGDNPYLPSNYSETLKESFGHDPMMLQAYLHGNWDVMVTSNTVISSKMLEDLKGKEVIGEKVKRVISCDPATTGDECVAYYFENYEIKDTLILHLDDTMKIVAELMLFGAKHKCDAYSIDTIGLGKGIVDRLRELGKKVLAINSAERKNAKHYNIRADVWWYAREKVLAKLVPYPEDPKLRKQISSVKLELIDSTGKVKLEISKDTKRRAGQSPDRACAWVYGIYGVDRIGETSAERSRPDYKMGRSVANTVEQEVVSNNRWHERNGLR